MIPMDMKMMPKTIQMEWTLVGFIGPVASLIQIQPSS